MLSLRTLTQTESQTQTPPLILTRKIAMNSFLTIQSLIFRSMKTTFSSEGRSSRNLLLRSLSTPKTMKSKFTTAHSTHVAQAIMFYLEKPTTALASLSTRRLEFLLSGRRGHTFTKNFCPPMGSTLKFTQLALTMLTPRRESALLWTVW